MTTRRKVFKSAGRDKKVEPITIEINGEEFTAKPKRSGAAVLDFIADAAGSDGGKAAQSLVNFISDSLIDDEESDRFEDYIRDEEHDVDIELLAEICEYLTEEYSSRPTKGSSASRRGHSTRGTSGSTGDSSEEE